MKRLLSLVAATAMILSLAACGGGSSAPVSNSADSSAATQPGASAASYTLSIGYTTASNDNDPYHLTALKFKEIVEKKSEAALPSTNIPAASSVPNPKCGKVCRSAPAIWRL